MAKVKVIQEDEVPTEVIAESIIAIASGIKKLNTGRLNRRAMLLLIQDAAPMYKNKKIGIKQIESVLDGMEQLEATFIKKKVNNG